MYFDTITTGEDVQSEGLVRVLHVASEAIPFAKVGGLADVVGSLPMAMKHLDVDNRLMLPAYREVKNSGFKLKEVTETFEIDMGDHKASAVMLQAEDFPITTYFLDCPEYFDREGIYGYETPDGFEDNLERYALLCKGVLEAMPLLNWMPQLIHAHDWQAALLPTYMAHLRNTKHPFGKVGTLYTIHNLAYQGNFVKDKRFSLGLYGKPFSWRKLKYFGKINMMKVGIVGADWVNTVSPGYRDETLKGGPTGAGMEVFLRNRKREYSGIINGIDYSNWDPSVDSHLAFQYQGDWLDFKTANKAALMTECGFSLSFGSRPLIGMVTRIVHQKGVDVVLDIIDDIVTLGFNLVVLGAGDRNYSDRFKYAARRYPGHIFYDFRYNEPMAHKIYAGADMFLMPSRFEPCGLSQMIAMHYGTIPVVHNVGGLRDTVEDFDSAAKAGTGFKFTGLYPQKVIGALQKAMWTYKDKETWPSVIENAVKTDFSWTKSAEAYLSLYKNVIEMVKQDNTMRRRRTEDMF